MRTIGLILIVMFDAALASSEVDPAAEWFRADAPHVYLVRQGEDAMSAARQFVKQPHFWDRVWCPWPGYASANSIAPGDLLVRVHINGRSWIQRVRRGDGERPHVRAMEAFADLTFEPFEFVPNPDILPPLHLAVDLTEVEASEPIKAIHAQITDVWPRTAEQPMTMIRVDVGSRDFLKIGSALLVIPAGNTGGAEGWLRAVVAAAFPQYSYAVLWDAQVPMAGEGVVRSPMAWCETG